MKRKIQRYVIFFFIITVKQEWKLNDKNSKFQINFDLLIRDFER